MAREPSGAVKYRLKSDKGEMVIQRAEISMWPESYIGKRGAVHLSRVLLNPLRSKLATMRT